MPGALGEENQTANEGEAAEYPVEHKERAGDRR
jgi:hypothetical protein